MSPQASPATATTDRLAPNAAVRAEAGGGGESVQVRALLQLRELILSGELAGGSRIAELAIVERLGVSRTPVRAALARLEQEGLLAPLPHGGYVVQTFSERDIADAIELRGTLEGLLARLAAERGVSAAVLAEAHDCLQQLDTVLAAPALDDEGFSAYVLLNSRFHALIWAMAESPTISRQLEKVLRLPFASPSGFVVTQVHSPRARDMLVVAQDQHREVLAAIEQREGARAEAILREHSRITRRNLQAAVQASQGLGVPGVQLIRERV